MHLRIPPALLPVALASLVLSGCASTPSAPQTPAPRAESRATGNVRQAAANLAPASGSLVSGRLAMVAMGGGVHVTGEIGGLQPGSSHGFHLHEKGDCSAADASSAGGHFNP
ncbi:MAG: superoxide dismutase family protein, partial [Lysobacteraceae bacterium]